MAVKYTAKYTDEHGNEHVATRTSRGHLRPEYTHAYWVRNPGSDVWVIGGYSRKEQLAVNMAARCQRCGCEAAAVTPVTSEVLASKR